MMTDFDSSIINLLVALVVQQAKEEICVHKKTFDLASFDYANKVQLLALMLIEENDVMLIKLL